LFIKHEKKGDEYVLTPPFFRLDLKIPEDIIEEVGRIYGYDKIPSKQLDKTSFVPKPEKTFYYENKIRDVLVGLGFSEVFTYSLTNNGDIEIANPLASDKNFLRSNLSEGIAKSLRAQCEKCRLTWP
jgi:phenylalanyl-tRNA synthetase beta chain